MSVALYETADDAALLWFERHEGVLVSGGHFLIELFSQSDISAADLGVDQLYIGVAVNDGDELAPRNKFGTFGRARVAFQALDVLGWSRWRARRAGASR